MQFVDVADRDAVGGDDDVAAGEPGGAGRPVGCAVDWIRTAVSRGNS